MSKQEIGVDTAAVAADAKTPAAVEDPPVTCPSYKYIFKAESDEWVQIETIIRVVSPKKVFGRGGMRVCYEVDELDEEGRGTAMVAKLFRHNISHVTKLDYFNEGKAQCMCEQFAINYNKSNVEVEKPRISFLQCYVVRIPNESIPEEYQNKRSGFFSYRTEDTQEVMFIMEPKMTGHFTKYNSNFGQTYQEEKKSKLNSEQTRKRHKNFEGAEAFSHFTLSQSGGSMLVCDLQGVNDFFTDPQIHSEDGKGLGLGNMGLEGIDKWVGSHVCNDICKALGLQPIDLGSHERSHYRNLRASLVTQAAVRPQDLVPMSKPFSEMTEDEQLEYAMQISRLTS